jgi:hypothetical protein
MAGKQTVIDLMELVTAAEQGRLSKVKSAANDEKQVFMFGDLAMRKAALNGHIEVMEYLYDNHFVSFIGKYGIEYRDVMANAPDEVKDWYREHTDIYIRMDEEWAQMVEDGVSGDDLLDMPDPDADTQHPLLTAASAGQFAAVIDLLIAEGRAGELTADHFLIGDRDSTLIGYLVTFGGLQDAFRPAVWVGRMAAVEKLWNLIPETVRPELTLEGIFEDTRHLEWLQMVRRKQWPRLKGSRGSKKRTHKRSGDK